MNLFKCSYKSLARRCNRLRKRALAKNQVMLPHIKGKTISIKSINCNFSGKWKTKRLTKNREKAKEFITKNTNTQENIMLLKAYSRYITPATQVKYKRKRASTVSHLKEPTKCVVCKTQDAYCNHHIQLLINGGGNEDYNLIPICKTCHKKIHDWLK